MSNVHTARRALVAALLLLLALAPRSAAAGGENLLYNGELDVPLQAYGWTSNSPGGWTPFDSDLCIASGAYSASRSGPSATPVVIRSSECLAVTPGAPLHVAARYASDADFTFVLLQFWDDLSCTGPPAGQQWGNAPATGGNWEAISVATTVPDGKAALTIQIESQSTSALSTTIDRVYVGAAPRVFADDFEGQQLCRWSAAAP